MREGGREGEREGWREGVRGGGSVMMIIMMFWVGFSAPIVSHGFKAGGGVTASHNHMPNLSTHS